MHPDEPNARILARLAHGKAGIVTAAAASDAGVGRGAVRHRLATGALHRLHWGVHAVGHADLCDEAHLHAALEAVGDGCAISHWSAARYRRLLHGIALSPVHVTLPRGRAKTRREGIEPHRPLDFDPLDVAGWGELPVTTVPRIVVELAPALSDKELALVVHRGRVEHGTALRDLRRTMQRAPRARGLVRVERVAFGRGVAPNRRERRFLLLVRRAGLPEPELNVLVRTPDGWFLVDCLWREQGLIYEIDDLRSHGTAKAFVEDRRRDAALQDAGLRVRRVTDDDLGPGAQRMLARLARQLRA
ncbi:MAG TPA: hypothetical protein VD931_09140 [Baekduia sp.]|nr:hypothetical protein [Baekduia sp.]